MILTRTPFRISLFGGGTDYPEWFEKNGGEVLGTSIDKYCYISLRRLPQFFSHTHRVVYSEIENVTAIEQIRHPSVREVLKFEGVREGLEIHHDGDLPARSGLGSSSAFTVGLINALRAFKGVYVDKRQLALDAIHVERDRICESVGCQDQVMAAYGGMMHVTFSGAASKFNVSPVVCAQDRVEALNESLLLFFTGLSRHASVIASDVIQSFSSTATLLRRMQDMVPLAIRCLQANDSSLADLGLMLREAWELKKNLATSVSNAEIDAMYDKAIKAGALGGKILGAGGGGFMLLFVPPDRQPAVKAALAAYVHVPFRFEDSGSRVVVYQPDGF
jgi:D-glycero-alpha-D-manno-heptose-7-phosphate kinase